MTVVGHAAEISAGEWITVSGVWVNDREHGQQFKAAFLRSSPPTTAEGIEKYVGSGMIRGIGPIYLSKLVTAFGAELFEVIEQAPERLREVPGIGFRTAEAIAARWASRPPPRFARGLASTTPCWSASCWCWWARRRLWPWPSRTTWAVGAAPS